MTRHDGKLVGTSARVSICDSGVGIPEALLTQVFEPFFTTKMPSSARLSHCRAGEGCFYTSQ